MLASDAQQLGKALGISPKKVRIVARYVGGGFGSKLGISPESVAAAIAAKQFGRPVKCVMSRQQVFDATVRRSNTEQRVRLGATADGKLAAIGHETLVSNLDGEGFFEPAGMATHFLYAGENRLITHDHGAAEPAAVGVDARAGRSGRHARHRSGDSTSWRKNWGSIRSSCGGATSRNAIRKRTYRFRRARLLRCLEEGRGEVRLGQARQGRRKRAKANG